MEMADNWVNCSVLSDQQLEEKIRDDKIDILIDLSHNTAGNRLNVFLNRPAPMQVSLLGLPMTTGLDCIDYAIRDQTIANKCNLQAYSSESILGVENKIYFDPLIDLPPISQPPCIDNGFITFGSFNGIRKIDKRLMEVWAKLLNALPGSKLKLMSDDCSNPHMKEYLHDIFKNFNVDVSQLILQPRLPKSDYLESHNLVDIALDSYPYHGNTTTYFSLLMGLPLVTRSGNSFVSNISSRILSAINRQHWVAQDFDEYVDIAISLAGDIDSLIFNRNKLREEIASSSLMDYKQATEGMEHALLTGWEKLCKSRL
jgi:predicted O-linked N-acetylglucosamine transferase (SPINDLY family)